MKHEHRYHVVLMWDDDDPPANPPGEREVSIGCAQGLKAHDVDQPHAVKVDRIKT